MRPISLKLRGAIGIYDGLGLDEISIDFTKYEPGLIALVGPNGAGKTTILENLHPYRQLASREGALSNHFRLRDSVRELCFEVGLNHYRSVVNIDSHTGKQEAYLYRGMIPLNDGKTTTYDVEVEKLLGSADLFFRSIFTAQNSKSITSLTAGKRKELFIELLGLQRYDLYAEYAKRKGDEYESELLTKRGKVQQIESETAGRDQLMADLEHAEGKHEALASQITTAEQNAEKCRKQVSKLELDIAENENYKKLLESLQAQERLLTGEKVGVLSGFEKESKEIDGKMIVIGAEIKRKEEIVSHAKEINEAVDELQTLRIEEKQLSVYKERLHQVEQEEAQAKLAYQKAKSEHEMMVANQERKIDTSNRQRERWISERKSLLDVTRNELTSHRTSANLINEVPFGEACRPCRFVSSAVASRDTHIPALEQQVKLLEQPDSTLTVIEKELDALDKTLCDLKAQPPVNGMDFTEKKAAVGYNAVRHAEVRKEIGVSENLRWEEFQKELGLAQTVLAEKQLQLQQLNEQLGGLKARTDQRTAELDVKIKDKRRELEGVEASISDTITGEYQAAIRDLDRLLCEAKDMHQQQITLSSDVATKRSRLERIDDLTTEKETLEGEILVLNRKIEHWRLLQRACSKDGIPALELDAAGPAVSRIANELLSSTFGTRFQIAFETTKLSKDKKKMMETFEIRVYGEEGEKNIEDLSGGQRVWIEKSIQEAIAIYLSEKGGKEYLTNYADESDGALDPDNKQHFLEMLRESFKLGRRHFTFLITQTPEIYQQIQQRIVLHPESSSVECVY